MNIIKNSNYDNEIKLSNIGSVIEPESVVGFICDSKLKSKSLFKQLYIMGYSWNGGFDLLTTDNQFNMTYPDYNNVAFMVINSLDKDDIDGCEIEINYDKSVMFTGIESRLGSVKYYYLVNVNKLY